MVWLEYAEVSLPGEWLQGTVTIDGEDYDVYRGAGATFSPGYTRDYLGFLRQSPKRAGTLNLSHFVQYLLAQGYISPSEYFRNVFPGNEIWCDTGDVTIGTLLCGAGRGARRDVARDVLPVRRRARGEGRAPRGRARHLRDGHAIVGVGLGVGHDCHHQPGLLDRDLDGRRRTPSCNLGM